MGKKIRFELILPKGTHAELVELLSAISDSETLKISGEITNEMALALGYRLAQICKSVSALDDPKQQAKLFIPGRKKENETQNH